MRTFIAIELDKEIKGTLAKIQDELKNIQADVKWVEPENIHLTLKFLGEVDENKIPKIIQSLKDAASQAMPFDIKLANVGVFPNLRYPRVIWVGSEENDARLSELADLVEESLVKLKFPKEKKRFSAHFTLGRVRSLKFKDDLGKKLGGIKIPELKVEIKSIVLFKSTLSSNGPTYEKIGEANLKS